MEPNIMPPSPIGESQTAVETAQHEKSVRFRIALFGFFLFIVFVVGLFWMITTPELTVGLTLSFVAGLSMIFLPCTLPLAFVIVPLTMGKDPKKGLLMALSFTLGLTITLSLYGVFIAAAGKAFGLKSDAEVYAVLLGGLAAFIFGLSEVGLINFKLPSYSGKFPDFIQRQKDYMKTFLLGLLLGNAGVGCPNPAFYILLGYIATTGDLFNGWFLGFVHGVGRSVPLIFLAILGTLGVNALAGVARHKEGIQKVMGWMLLIIGAYLLTFGIFGHDWFIASGIHSWWEQFVVNISGERFGETILQHKHRLIDVPNFIQYGNMFFLGLLALTILTAFVFKRPSRRTIISLVITYIIIAFTIGYSTGWTFKIGTNVSVHFKGAQQGTSPGTHVMSDGTTMVMTGNTMTHEEKDITSGLSVNFNHSPAQPHTGSSTRMDLFVNKKPGNVAFPAELLELNHGKLMHLIGVRSDMNEFFHIHPEPIQTTGVLSTEFVFSKPGRYKIWSEILFGGTIHVIGHPEFSISGEGVVEEKKIIFSPTVISEGYQVTLSSSPMVLAKNQPILFALDIHSSLGEEVQLEDYLGVPAHMAIIRDDWKEFMHTHPIGPYQYTQPPLVSSDLIPRVSAAALLAHTGAHDMRNVVSHGLPFDVTFSSSGIYRIYVQFRPRGIDLPQDEALTASFWIKVEEKASSSISSWWILLIASIILMILLSLGVRKFLRVDPNI